jgi:hypothetical protein
MGTAVKGLTQNGTAHVVTPNVSANSEVLGALLEEVLLDFLPPTTVDGHVRLG